MALKSSNNVETNVYALEIEISAEEFDAAQNKVFAKQKNRIQLPGFRKGKVTRKMAENFYGKGWLYEDALDICFPKAVEEAAKEAEPYKCFVDPDAKDFAAPGNMPKRVQEFCKRTGQYVPQNMGEILRCIYQSLAFKYRYTVEALEKISNKKLEKQFYDDIQAMYKLYGLEGGEEE